MITAAPLALPARTFHPSYPVAWATARQIAAAAEVKAQRVAAARDALAVAQRDAGFVISRVRHEAARTAGLAALAAAKSVHDAWEAVEIARRVSTVCGTAPEKRWGAATRAARAHGHTKADRVAAARTLMLAAGVPAKAATLKAAGAAFDALNALAEKRSERDEAEKSIALRERPLSARLANGIGTPSAPAALRDSMRAYRAAFVGAFRWPDNAAQKAPRCSVFLAAKAEVRQTVGSAWTDYSKRERHQCSTSEVDVMLHPRMLRHAALWVIDGVVSVDLRQMETRGDVRVFGGVFARQSRGVTIESSEGYLAVAPDGTAVHGTSARGALAALSRRRNEAAQVAQEAAERVAQAEMRAAATKALGEAVGATPRGMGDLRLGQMTALLAGLDRTVTLTASLSAGNCHVGSAAWIARRFPGQAAETAAATVREVLRAAWQHNDLPERTVRACLAAVARPETLH